MPHTSEIAEGSATQFVEGLARPRILVVDDNELVAEVAAALLDALGYDARVVTSPTDALDAFEEQAFVAVLSDIVMPGDLSGVQLAKRLRQRSPDLPVLLSTGYSEALAYEVVDFPVLHKPYGLMDLEGALGRLFGSKPS
jgi:CheY-like chemotaxis protein